MAFPRLIDFVPVPAGQVVPCAGAWPVMSDLRQSKVIPRFLLTWAAATHWPRFLNPVQAWEAGMPVSEWILSPIAGFLPRMLLIVDLWVEPPLLVFAFP